MSIIRSGSFPESVMLRHLKRLAHRQAERTQFGQRVLGIAMMHERPTGFFPEMPVLERVIDEDVASLGMAALVDSHAGDDLRAGKCSATQRSFCASAQFPRGPPVRMIGWRCATAWNR